MGKLKPTYSINDIIERVDFFDADDLSILARVISDERNRYTLTEELSIKKIIADRHGTIVTEKLRKRK